LCSSDGIAEWYIPEAGAAASDRWSARHWGPTAKRDAAWASVNGGAAGVVAVVFGSGEAFDAQAPSAIAVIARASGANLLFDTHCIAQAG
jgi:hypothetical protein